MNCVHLDSIEKHLVGRKTLTEYYIENKFYLSTDGGINFYLPFVY
jgi:hypothetical protein